MHTLLPFTPHANSISLQADVLLSPHTVTLVFTLTDPAKRIKNSITKTRVDCGPRTYALWANTCFEAFLQREGEARYWEFNVAANGAWNCFSFDDYRTPQPPRECRDFELSSFKAEDDTLTAVFKTVQALSGNFHIGLTAVLVMDGTPNYYALAHTGAEPDFHRADSFVVTRRV